jgi:hypothetical protein
MIVPFPEVVDAEVRYVPEVSTQEEDVIVSVQEVVDAKMTTLGHAHSQDIHLVGRPKNK